MASTSSDAFGIINTALAMCLVNGEVAPFKSFKNGKTLV